MGDVSNWAEAFTDAGEPYYYHATTGETRWDPPVGWGAGATIVPAELPVDPNPEPAAVSGAEGGVYNVATSGDMSTAITPAASGTLDTNVVEGAIAAGDVSNWAEVFTEAGEPYYYNATTGETQWDPPVGWGVRAEAMTVSTTNVDIAGDGGAAFVTTAATEGERTSDATQESDATAPITSKTLSSDQGESGGVDDAPEVDADRVSSGESNASADPPSVDQVVRVSDVDDDAVLSRNPSSFEATIDIGEPSLQPSLSRASAAGGGDDEEGGSDVKKEQQQEGATDKEGSTGTDQVETPINPENQAIYDDFLAGKGDDPEVIPIPDYNPDESIAVGLKHLNVDMDLKDLVSMFQTVFMEEFIEQRYNYNRKTAIFTDMISTTEKLSNYKPESIKSALLKIRGDEETIEKHNKDALIAMGFIINFMSQHSKEDLREIRGTNAAISNEEFKIYDIPADEEAMFIASELLLLFQRGDERMKDEVYCQLIKQTTNNKDEVSCCHGWQLLLMTIAVAAPSEALQPYLMGHCVRTSKVSIIFVELYTLTFTYTFRIHLTFHICNNTIITTGSIVI